MSEISQAADGLKNVAGKLKGLLLVANVLEKIGSLEQAAKDAECAKDKSYKLAEEAKKEAEKAHQELQKVLQDVEAAKAKLPELERQSQGDRAAVLESAKEEAKAIVKEAVKQKVFLEAEIAGLKGQLESSQKEVEAKKAEVSELQNKLQDLKAKLAQFLKA